MSESDQELRELERLTGILERERTALCAGVGDAIAGIAAEKAAHAGVLAELAARRRAPPGALLLAAASVARRLNEINGQLIEAHARAVAGRLAVLATSATPPTYGADGARYAPPPPRALGRA